MRLMLLALTDIMCTLPLGIYVMYSTGRGIPPAPWISWDDTHFDFGQVHTFFAFFWRNNYKLDVSLELTRWVPVFAGLVFFALFGFASEARKQYAKAFWFVVGLFGIRRPVKKAPSASASLPRYGELPPPIRITD
jgi:pheromone a factor receptor